MSSNNKDDNANKKKQYQRSRFPGGGGLPVDPARAARITSIKEDAPVMRAVKLAPPHETLRHFSSGFETGKPRSIPSLVGSSLRGDSAPEMRVIDRNDYKPSPPGMQTALGQIVRSEGTIPPAVKSNWIPIKLRAVPAYYPLEKSHRIIEDADFVTIAARLSECLRMLSVHAHFDDETATASLHTPEHVEMHLSLWQGAPKYPYGTVVELQRRKGCSITFHRYSRLILDYAEGDLGTAQLNYQFGEEGERSMTRMAERLLNSELPKGSGAGSEKKNSYIALEIAASLLKKDRMDARQLGMESLCLLTDPRRTGLTTAKIASRVVLLGNAHSADELEDADEDDRMFEMSELGIREAILQLVQFSRLGDEGDFDMDLGESEDEYDSDSEKEDRHPEEKEHNDLLHNLALAVLANALDVLENYDMEIEDTKPSALGVSSTSEVADSFIADAETMSKQDIMKTLIKELGKSELKPHDACLSAKCLRSLCRASRDARRRAHEMDALKVVNTALEVGQKTHAKLETETKKVIKTLGGTTE